MKLLEIKKKLGLRPIKLFFLNSIEDEVNLKFTPSFMI